MTIDELLRGAEQHIPALDAQILLAHAVGERREYLLAHPEARIARTASLAYRFLVFRRRRGTPVAYLTGRKEFFGLEFFVNRHVLIPRPETELLVELALNHVKSQMSDVKSIFIDIGTGSGCIPIAIAYHLNTLRPRHPGTQFFAIDASKKALAVAKRNAARHGAPIKFLQGNLLEPLFSDFRLQTSDLPLGKADFRHMIITANLPYLTPLQYAQEPSIHSEPKRALVGGKTGLELYDALLSHMQTLHCDAFFEIDPSQSAAMTRLIQSHFPQASVEIHQDLCGRDRVVSVYLAR